MVYSHVAYWWEANWVKCLQKIAWARGNFRIPRAATEKVLTDKYCSSLYFDQRKFYSQVQIHKVGKQNSWEMMPSHIAEVCRQRNGKRFWPFSAIYYIRLLRIFLMEVRRHIRSFFRPISHQKVESIAYPMWVSNHCCDYYKSLTYNVIASM